MVTQLRRKRSTQVENTYQSVVKTEEGYRVRMNFDPSKSYLVTVDHGQLHCSCSDFQSKKSDPDHSCRHIVAVIEFDNERTTAVRAEEEFDDTTLDPTDESWQEEQARARDDAQTAAETVPFCPPNRHGPESIVAIPASRMFIKRSLSPDGRIDSVSVELDLDVDPEDTEEIRERA